MGTVRFAAPLGVINVSEGAGFLEHVVELSAPSTQLVTVTITGPAYRAGDMDVTTQVLTFQPGQTTATFRVAIIDDQIYEGDEVYGYEITSATNAQINMSVENGADVRKLVGYIIDNDLAQGPTVRFAQPLGVINVSEGAGFLEHVVQLSAPSTQAVTVTITGPAYRVGDMDVTTQVLTFQPGQTTATFRVAIIDDQIYEGDEVYGYEITSATNAQINMSVENGADVRKLVGYIIDNDLAQGPTVRFAQPLGVINVSEGAGFLEHVVQLSAPSTQAVTVTITGPAYRVGDMDVTTQVLTFQPGQTTATFRVAIIDDQNYEGDEVYGYEITSATNAQINMSVENGADVRKLVGYIIDNDTVSSSPTVLRTAVSSVLRWTNDLMVADLNAKVLGGTLTSATAIAEIVKTAAATTSVASLAYEFFTGKIPTSAGVDYLVSPTGPNANNLNSAYYQSFNLENRYINFAVNLGKIGEGKEAFATKHGALTLFDATREAYKTIFGAAPTDTKIHALIDSRADYFAIYGGDGVGGIGAKAAMVGWLLAEAEKADIGVMARSNDAWLTDLANGSAPFAIDILDPAKGYWKADFVFGGT